MELMPIFSGIIALASGVPMVFAPRLTHAKAKKSVAARISDLEAGADETYFEELRALRAYPVPATERRWLVVGMIQLVFGVVLLALGLTGKP